MVEKIDWLKQQLEVARTAVDYTKQQVEHWQQKEQQAHMHVQFLHNWLKEEEAKHAAKNS